MRISASGVELAMTCPGPAILPRVNRLRAASDRGNVIHAFIEGAAKLGGEAALSAVPVEHREECARVDLSPLAELQSQGIVHVECAMAWNPWTDTTRHLGDSLGRDYQTGEDEIAGTADVMCNRGDSAIIADWKTGVSEIAAAKDNWQMRFLAVAVSRWLGVSSVEVRLYKLQESGGWYCDPAVFDALDLDGFADEMRRRFEHIRRVEARYRDGIEPDLTAGEHCKRCNSVPYCAAQTALAKRVTSEIADVRVDGFVSVDRVKARVAELTSTEAGEAYAMLQQAEAFTAALREAIETRAAVEDLPLPDGRTLRMVKESREFIRGDVAEKVIAAEFGEDVAAKVIKRSVSASKDAIYKALPKAEAKRAIQAIRDNGGVVVKPYERPKAV